MGCEKDVLFLPGTCNVKYPEQSVKKICARNLEFSTQFLYLSSPVLNPRNICQKQFPHWKKNPKYPSIRTNCSIIHMVECYSMIKISELLIDKTIWVNCKYIRLSQGSQTQKSIYCKILFF